MARITDFLNREQQAAPQQEVGIGGFTALCRVRESYNLSASVPATPVEDGSVVHDHIILDPLTISIEGDVSDVHLRASPVLRDIRRLQAEIGSLTSQYAPTRTQTQLSQVSALANDALDAARRVDALLDAGEQIANLFGNQDPGSTTNRQRFIDHMEALRNGRQLITIDMPYRRCERMVITSLAVRYDNVTDATVFTLEAQQVRLAELQLTAVRRVRAAGLGGQTTPEANKGAQAGTPVSRSLASNLIGYVREGF